MLGILITLAIVTMVAYCVLKNYYPPIVLLLAGFVMLVCAAATGTMPVAADTSGSTSAKRSPRSCARSSPALGSTSC